MTAPTHSGRLDNWHLQSGTNTKTIRGMKRCGRCKTEKPFAAFSKSKSERDGHFGFCKECQKAARATYKKREQTPEDKRRAHEKWLVYSAQNKDKIRARKQRYAQQNRAKIAEYQRVHEAKKRAHKLNAIPKWADLEEIKKFYTEAEIMTKITGVEHQVDHIVPLRNKYVCGLHTPANLRVVTAEVNMKKGNKLYRG
jgi:hypothetical protein